MQVCARCERVIAATTKDPVIAAGSLGAGAFHEKCAALVWREQALETLERKEESSSKRSAAMRARHAEKDSVGSRGVAGGNDGSDGGGSVATSAALDADSPAPRDRADSPRRRRGKDREVYRLPAEDE